MKKRLLFPLFAWLLPLALPALEVVPLAPRDGATVPLLNNAQKAFLAMPRAERVAFFADAAKRKQLVKTAHWWPRPVDLAWQSDAPGQTKFRVLVSEHADMSDPLVVTGRDGKAKIDDLKIGTTYYWRVEAIAPDGNSALSKIGSFSTENAAPRLLRLPNVPNVRDLGGRKTKSGMYVKQGRIFRTAGLNYNAKIIRAKDEAELLAAFPDYRQILPLWQEWKKRAESERGAPTVVPYKLSRRWTVFELDRNDLDDAEAKQLDTLSAVPKKLFGASSRVLSANERGRLELAFDGARPRTAVLMQEFTSPSDGVMQLSSGADWAWNVRLNGKIVFSRMQGNGKTATTSNYHYFVPVRKGKNLIVVVLKSGDRRWMWCCGRRKPQELRKNIDDNLAALYKTPLSVELGANRLTEEGMAICLERWRVRSDIDLRSDKECAGMTGSPLGKSVKWHHISSAAYSGVHKHWGKAQFAKAFKVFLDESNYPIIFHCIGGQDRTGSLAFILNGLLGVDEEELYRDWEATGFWNPNEKFNHELRFDRLIDGFRQLPGKDINEQIENYVLSCGFSRDDIARFRALMLEER